MGGIDDEHVHARGDERLCPLERILADTDRRAGSQPAERILAGERVRHGLLDVLDGNQPLQPEVAVDDEKFLDLVLVQDLARLVQRCADGHGEQGVLRHHLVDGPVHIRLEPEIAVGEDADEPPILAAVISDRHAGDAVLLHQVERFLNAVVRPERDRVDDHAALRPLHPIHFRCLFLDRQVLVDDAEAAVLGHGDRQARLGDGVHRGAEQRHVQAYVARQPRRDVDLRRQHGGVLRHQQDVVERQRGGELGSRGKESQRAGLQFHWRSSRAA